MQYVGVYFLYPSIGTFWSYQVHVLWTKQRTKTRQLYSRNVYIHFSNRITCFLCNLIKSIFWLQIYKHCTCIQNSTLAFKELPREDRDMFTMGKLSCTGSCRCIQRGKDRQRKQYTNMYVFFFKNNKTWKVFIFLRTFFFIKLCAEHCVPCVV